MCLLAPKRTNAALDRGRFGTSGIMEFCSIYLPELPVATICSFVRTAEDLRSVACLCHDGSRHAQTAATHQIERIQMRLEISSRLQERITSILSLRRWERTAAAQRVWLDARHCDTQDPELPGGIRRVLRVHDLSGNGMHAQPAPNRNGPELDSERLNRQPVLQFGRDMDGTASIMQTPQFETPLQTPVTFFVVAKAWGDVTILDHGEGNDERMELCHGCARPPSPSPVHSCCNCPVMQPLVSIACLRRPRRRLTFVRTGAGCLPPDAGWANKGHDAELGPVRLPLRRPGVWLARVHRDFWPRFERAHGRHVRGIFAQRNPRASAPGHDVGPDGRR